jgi:hypothetical protein
VAPSAHRCVRASVLRGKAGRLAALAGPLPTVARRNRVVFERTLPGRRVAPGAFGDPVLGSDPRSAARR